MLPSLTVVVVSRKDNLVFDTTCVNFKSGFSKAIEINRNDLLEYKEKNINKRVPLVLTYHPSLEKSSGIARHHWKEIEKSETLGL
jgi:hypothetical protein